MAESWPKEKDQYLPDLNPSSEEKLAGDLTEEMLTTKDIGLIKEDFEEDVVTKPSKDNHICRINNGKYTSYRSEKRKHKGKPYTVRYGKRESDGEMEEYEYFYPIEHWTVAEAKSHCKDHDGKFEAAKDEKCEDCEPVIIEEPGKQGLSPDNIEPLAKELYGLIQRKKSLEQLEKHLKNSKRR